MQRVTGDLMRVSVGTCCEIIHKVSRILASLMRDFIKFPSTPAARTRAMQAFYGIARFPGVVGCVDGTHVGIRNPGGPHAEVYRNRKGRFSINVQVLYYTSMYWCYIRLLANIYLTYFLFFLFI